MMVYVLVAKYSDNSEFRVIRVYSSRDDADQAVEIIQACQPSMDPEVLEVEYVKGRYE